MRNVMRYSGIVTKVAAMRAKLLKPQDYEQLASMDTVTDIIEYLKQTKSYGKFITQMDESLYHRGNIEKVLIQSLYDDYTRLYRFADMQQKDFLMLSAEDCNQRKKILFFLNYLQYLPVLYIHHKGYLFRSYFLHIFWNLK